MTDPDRWGSLQVRYLRAFTTVVDEGSFAAAAHILGYSQSGISQQIFALERTTGAPLLTRHPGGRRPLELTPAGTLMLGHARAVLARISTTAADLNSLASGETARLAVYTVPSFGARILPAILGRFRDRQAGVHVSIAQALALSAVTAAVKQASPTSASPLVLSPTGRSRSARWSPTLTFS
jgi:DNA-binding transcriptional LysR family regulator